MLHKPEHLDRLATAARFIAEKMDYGLVLPDHQPGYLVVQNSVCSQVLLALHVGTSGHLCDELLVGNAKHNNTKLFEHPYNSEEVGLMNGTTSSDVYRQRAGSVAASNLIIGYASRDGQGCPFGNEAVAIMIAIKAGVLPRSAIKKRYCNRRHKEHNAALREMIDTITWTD